MSGLSRTPGKRVWVYPHRGFESRPLRQKSVFSGSPLFATVQIKPCKSLIYRAFLFANVLEVFANVLL